MSFAKSNTGQALWLGIGSLSTIAISLVSVMILSRYFDKSTYGTYRQIIFIYNSLLVIFSAGLPKIFAYYLPKIDRRKGKEVTSRITSILLLLGLLFGLTLFLGANLISEILNNPDLESNLRLFAIVPCLLLPTLGIEGIFTSYKESHYIAIYNSITKLFLLIAIIAPVIYYGSEIKYALYGWIVGSAFSLILALYFKQIPFNNLASSKSGISTKQILGYSLPLVLASISGILIKAADQFYISRYFGEEVFAEFSNGFTPLPFVALISGSAGAVLMPIFSSSLENGKNIKKVAIIFKSTLIKSGLLIYPLVIFCFVNAQDTIIILFSEEYINSVLYFRMFLILHFFNIIIFAPLLFAAGETRFYARIHVFMAVAIWLLGYIVVIVFNNPYMIALLSIILAIVLRVFAMLKTSQVVELKLSELIPFKDLALVFLHCLLIVSSIKTIFWLIGWEHGIFYFLLNLLISSILILITARIINLNYLLALMPILQKLGIKL